MRGELMASQRSGGFTLIELLVVIAILGVLATTVILVLNPAELLKQARDSNRLSDLASINSALSLFLTDTMGGQSMGSSSITYLSLPEQGSVTDCSDLGFPPGYFHCSPSSTAQSVSGTGWIPVDFTKISSGSPLSKLPVDPVNSSSSDLYYAYWTNESSYKVMAMPESNKEMKAMGSDPQMFQIGSNLGLGGGPNWAPVPGNSSFGTNNFYVMQFDAGCSDSSGNILNSPLDGMGYKDNSANCSVAYGRYPISVPDAAPIVDVSHNSALSYCQSIGAHLLTNDEWMTIATNAVEQGVNWSGGSVGSGYVPRGNSNSAAAMWSGGSQYGTGYSDFTHLRTLTLSNGSVVWDMGGNIYQYVQRSTLNQGDNTNAITAPTCSAIAGWCQYGDLLAPYVTAWNDPSFNAATVAPPNPSWNSTQNMGQIYPATGSSSIYWTTFRRGGSWSGGLIAGPFSLDMDWTALAALNYGGFRCAR